MHMSASDIVFTIAGALACWIALAYIIGRWAQKPYRPRDERSPF